MAGPTSTLAVSGIVAVPILLRSTVITPLSPSAVPLNTRPGGASSDGLGAGWPASTCQCAWVT
ncbi:MAG: hypothetical protein V9G12_01995 [Microthrixaceae bacterium]